MHAGIWTSYNKCCGLDLDGQPQQDLGVLSHQRCFITTVNAVVPYVLACCQIVASVFMIRLLDLLSSSTHLIYVLYPQLPRPYHSPTYYTELACTGMATNLQCLCPRFGGHFIIFDSLPDLTFIEEMLFVRANLNNTSSRTNSSYSQSDTGQQRSSCCSCHGEAASRLTSGVCCSCEM